MANLSVEMFAVTVVDLSGVSHVAVTTDRDQAISHFMLQAYLFAHAAPDQTFRVVGGDVDAALSGLHLIWDRKDGAAVELASLSIPGSIGASPGWVAPDYAKKSFFEIGSSLDAALRQHEGKLEPAEVERLRNSRAAFALGRPLAEVLISPDDADQAPIKVSQATAKRTWDAMASVDQYVEMLARVTGG
jgi:hypothetical protein